MTVSNDDKLALSMGILCFQGFGIRIFEGVMEGAIVLWLMVLTIMNWRYVRLVPSSYWFKVGLAVVGYALFSLIKGVPVVPYLVVAWLSAAVVLTPYYLGQADFVHVMRRFTRFCMYYCLCHIPIMLFLKDALITTSFGMHPKTFLYLFYFNGGEGFAGMNRIQGFCWEPSCWNLLLDLNLVFALYFKEKRSIVIASIIAIVSIMSTTGLMVMLIIMVLYCLINLRMRNIIRVSIVLGLFAAIVGPIIYSNVTEKLASGSGNARIGDFAIAATVMKNHPWLGIDYDNLTQNMLVLKARDEAWTSQGDYQGYMNQGMVNSFAALVVEWGVPVTIIIFVLMFRTPLIDNKQLRFLYLAALLCVLMGTPIARTGFFYMYAISSLLMVKQKKQIYVGQ